MKIIIVKSHESELVNEIEISLKNNGGYCPCRSVQNEDTKCMCKEFREQIKNKTLGTCHCGLYEIKEKGEE